MASDIGSVFTRLGEQVDWGEYSMPTHYTSLLVAFLVCVVFFYAATRIGLRGSPEIPLARMTAALVFLVLVYLLIGLIAGFSVLLGIGVLVAVYGLCDPGFGASNKALRDRGYVL